jgi:hypothetical protein
MSNDMSRRKELLLSLGGALGLSLPTALIASEEAEAQTTVTPATGTPAAGAAPATGTPGMQRRAHRRGTRHQRRQVRRGNVPATTAAPAAKPQ